MFHDGKPAHLNELLLFQKQVGEVLARSRDVQERVWGLHLLEDWKTLSLLAQRDPETEFELSSAVSVV